MTTMISDYAQRDFFVSSLNDQRKGGEYCDVLLKVSGQTLPTHGCVLAARSPVFRELIHNERPLPPHLTDQPQEIDVELPNLEEGVVGDWLSAMQDLVNYIYTGEIALMAETIDLVLILAEAFRLKGLLALVKIHTKRGSRTTVQHPNPSTIMKLTRTTIKQPKLSSRPPQSTVQEQNASNIKNLLQNARTNKVVISHTSSNASLDSTEDSGVNDVPDGVSDQLPEVTATGVTSSPRVSARLRKRKINNRLSDTLPDASPKVHEAKTAARPRVSINSRTARRRVVRSRKRPRVPSGDLSEPEQSNGHDDDDEELEAFCKKSRKITSKKKMLGDEFACRHPGCEFKSADARSIILHKRDHPFCQAFKCLTCGLFLRYPLEMVEHLREANHEETDCSVCGSETTDRQAFLEHISKHANPIKPNFCWICLLHTRSRTQLEEHMVVHDSALPYQCDQCPRGFKWKSSLVSHKRAHAQVRSFMCDQCDYSSAHIQNLRHHLRKHTSPPLCCEHCSYQTHCKFRLENHKVRHFDTKSFVCDVCGIGVKGGMALKIHTRTFHDPDGPKLRCTLCDFFTARREKLRMHAQKHHGGLGTEALDAPRVITPRKSHYF